MTNYRRVSRIQVLSLNVCRVKKTLVLRNGWYIKTISSIVDDLLYSVVTGLSVKEEP